MTEETANSTETEVSKEKTEPKKQNAVVRVTGEIVHEFAGKLVSRKLSVWVVATFAFFGGYMDAEMWGYISLAYLGGQSFLDYGKSRFSR